MATKKKVTKKKVSKKKAKKKVVKKKTAIQRKNKMEVSKRNPKAAGNATKTIDWDTVNKLCKLQCTGEEIASVIEVDYETLNKHCKTEQGIGFGKYLNHRKKSGKASLRRRQWLTAESGNATMQIWLGKQYLNQTDKSLQHIEISQGETFKQALSETEDHEADDSNEFGGIDIDG